MIATISPALNMDTVTCKEVSITTPDFWESARQLACQFEECTPWQLESILKVNPELALKAFDYYQEFGKPPAALSPAMLSFQGLVFKNIGAGDFTKKDLAYAQGHLRIFSALYGILKPLDGISPYRLDFMSKFKVSDKSLYHYWGDRVYRKLFEQDDTVVNLCSDEYFKLIKPYLTPPDQVITCKFLVKKKGQYKTITTEAKMARGRMVRYIVKNRIEDPERLKDFREGGFIFSEDSSSPRELVFLKT